MEIIYFMIGLSILLALGFLLSFFWAADNHQFEDLSMEPWRVLWEELDHTPGEDNEKES